MEEFKKGFYFGLGFIISNLFVALIVGSIILGILALTGFNINSRV